MKASCLIIVIRINILIASLSDQKNVLQPPLNERNFQLRPVFRAVDPSLTRELFPPPTHSSTLNNWEQQRQPNLWSSGGGSSGPNNFNNNPIATTSRSKFAVPPELEQVLEYFFLKITFEI